MKIYIIYPNTNEFYEKNIKLFYEYNGDLKKLNKRIQLLDINNIKEINKFRKKLIRFDKDIKLHNIPIINTLKNDLHKIIIKINEIKKNYYQSIHTQRYFANYLNLPQI